jgi:hypothetical protein
MKNKARYDPEYRPTETDINEVIQTYKEPKEIAHKFLVRKEKANNKCASKI